MFKLRTGAMPAAKRASALLVACGSCFGASAAWANGAHTGHQFSVTESGAATISIPIQVPRGVGGIEPQLSLNYSSGAGNGLLGIGWTLAGPSAITRCPKTIDPDGVRGAVKFANADRFCLDGQRLIAQSAHTDATYGSSGMTYKTQRDSFSRITAVGNYGGQTGVPASFQVETKAGLILHFGLSDNSRVLTNMVDGTLNTVNRWMLQRIEDRMPTASSVEFVYCRGEVAINLSCSTGTYTGSQVLRYIQYTNRGSTLGTNAVVFSYEARPDRQLQYHYGSSSVQTQRMTGIATHLGFVAGGADAAPASLGTRVKAYELTYDPMTNASGQWIRATNHSRLLRVQEVRGDITSPRPAPSVARPVTEALPPLDFAYAEDAVYGKTLIQTSGSSATPVSPPKLDCGGHMSTWRRNEICP
jgi:Salmonella virulence plasmid 65kDa B protein